MVCTNELSLQIVFMMDYFRDKLASVETVSNPFANLADT